MDSQLAAILAAMQAKLDSNNNRRETEQVMQAKLGTLTTIDERLSKLETILENRNEHEEECDRNHNECDGECGPLIQYEGQNV